MYFFWENNMTNGLLMFEVNTEQLLLNTEEKLLQNP